MDIKGFQAKSQCRSAIVSAVNAEGSDTTLLSLAFYRGNSTAKSPGDLSIAGGPEKLEFRLPPGRIGWTQSYIQRTPAPFNAFPGSSQDSH